MDNNIKEALDFIDVASLSYEEWLSIGMALKAEGFDVSVWDNWSKNDKRYKPGVCEKKWNSFNGSANPVSGGTIIQMAKDKGYVPIKREYGPMEWDDVIEYDGEPSAFEFNVTQTPVEQLISYLQTLFEDNEYVSYVTESWKGEDGKFMPSKGVFDRTAKQLIEALKKHPDDIGAVIGDWNKECGAWIRFNPVDGTGIKNENVTRFGFALVESDDMPISEQDAIYRKFELPIACLINSGGKSLHAIVKVDAKDQEEYRKRVEYLYDFLEKKGLKIDKANRNPSRLSRLPGVTRNGNEQSLIDTNIGRHSWADWMDWVEGENDELPSLENLKDGLEHLEPLAPERIHGILRDGHKMLISGPSKAGKSYLLGELAICLSEGIEWLGFKCEKSKVLYVNLEIDAVSIKHRFQAIYDAMKIKATNSENITLWNLRGFAVTLDKLVPKLIRRISKQEYNVVIIDPIYKVMMGDENSASDMGAFCNQFDKICTQTGCSVIYCHHHSKGAQGSKKAMDRASGSGVFARDPDAQLDMIQLDTDEEFLNKNADNPNATAWRLECSLREFPNFKPVNFWFDYPLHKVDVGGLLKKKFAEGDPLSNLERSGKRRQTSDARKEQLDDAFNIISMGTDTVEFTELVDYIGKSEKTVRDWIREFKESYVYKDGKVTRIEPKDSEGGKDL